MFNHALLKGNDFYEDKIKEINGPTLVIHCTENTILPFEHAQALVNGIPGHEIHADNWDTIIKAISNHTSIN